MNLHNSMQMMDWSELSEKYPEVFDVKRYRACVRLKSGHVAVVDHKGNVLTKLGKFQRIEFAEHDFVRVVDEPGFYVDLRSNTIFSYLPEIKRMGSIELLLIGGFIYTRTSPVYGVRGSAPLAHPGRDYLYVSLPCDSLAEQNKWVKRMITDRHRAVCLLAGDADRYYWLYRELSDGSVVVMDDKAIFYRVVPAVREGKVTAHRKRMVQMKSVADRTMVEEMVGGIEQELAERRRRAEVEVMRQKEQERWERMKQWVGALPFRMGNKWGLKLGERMVVPPLYREISAPVGYYCAVEMLPRQWGVIALDGRVVVEPKFEEVELLPDGSALLTLFKGKTKRVQLPQSP